MGRCRDCGASLEYDDGASFCLVCDERKGACGKAADSPWTPEPTLEVLTEIADWVTGRTEDNGSPQRFHGPNCWREHPECKMSILFKAIKEGDFAGVGS